MPPDLIRGQNPSLRGNAVCRKTNAGARKQGEIRIPDGPERAGERDLPAAADRYGPRTQPGTSYKPGSGMRDHEPGAVL